MTCETIPQNGSDAQPTDSPVRELVAGLQRGEMTIIEDVDGPLVDNVTGTRNVRQAAYRYVRERGPDGLLDLPMTSGARNALKTLTALGNTIKIATNRPEVCEELTETWLVMHDIPHDEYVGCVDGDKTERVTGDVVIDDGAEQVIQAAESGKIGVLFNRNWTDVERAEDHSNVVVIDGWSDLLMALNEPGATSATASARTTETS